MKKIILHLLLLCVNLNLVAQTNIYLKSTVIDYSKEFNVNFSEENNYCFMVFDVIPNDAQKLNLRIFWSCYFRVFTQKYFFGKSTN